MRLRLWWRRAVSSPGASALVLLTVLVMAIASTVVPRVEARTFDAEVAYRVDRISPIQRALQVTVDDYPFPAESFAAQVSRTLTEHLAKAGPQLRPLLGAPGQVVRSTTQTTPMAMSVPPPADLAGLTFTFGFLPEAELDAVTIDGARPGPGQPAPAPGENPAPPVQDALLAAPIAQRMGLQVGDTLTFAVSSDQDGRGLQTVRICGLYTATDPADELWQVAPTLRQGDVENRGDAGLVATATLLSTPEHADWMDRADPSWRLTGFARTAAPRGQDTPAVADQLAVFQSLPLTLGAHQPAPSQMTTTLGTVLDATLRARAGTDATLAMLAAGPAGVALALLTLTARLSVQRRRDSFALIRARGGAAAGVRAGLAAEGLLLAVPAAALGALVGVLLTPGPPARPGQFLGAAALALAPAALLATTALPSLRSARADGSVRSRSRLRWVAEVLVLLATAGSLYLVLGPGHRDPSRLDPVAAALPLLLAVTVALLVARLLPLPLALLHALAARGRGIGAFLGTSRAGRDTQGVGVCVFAVLVAASVAVAVVALFATTDAGLTDAARTDVGADVQVNTLVIDDDDAAALRALPGVRDLATAAETTAVQVRGESGGGPVGLFTVDATDLARIQRDVPHAVDPAGLAGLREGRLPLIASPGTGLRVGETVSVEYGTFRGVDGVVIGLADAAPGLPTRDRWAMVDRATLVQAAGTAPSSTIALLSLDAGADPDAVGRAALAALDGVGNVRTAAGVEATQRAAPVVHLLRTAFPVLFVAALVMAVLAMIFMLVLGAPARGRSLSVLRTLGLSARDADRVVAWEIGPTLGVAAVAGLGLGLGLPALLRRAIDLRTVTGGRFPPEPAWNWPLLGAAVLAVALAVGLSTLLAAALARRLTVSQLRIGDAT